MEDKEGEREKITCEEKITCWDQVSFVQIFKSFSVFVDFVEFQWERGLFNRFLIFEAVNLIRK